MNSRGRKQQQPKSCFPTRLSHSGRRISFVDDEKILADGLNSNLTSSNSETRLNDWLIRNNVDVLSRNMILGEEFGYEDFVYEMTKEEMFRIGLK